MRRLLIFAGLLTGCAGSPPALPPMAREALVDQLERGLVLPPGAGSLDTYARAWWVEEGRLIGFLVQPNMVPGLQAGRSLMSGPPDHDVLDGGCAVIHVRADAASGRVESVICNGES